MSVDKEGDEVSITVDLAAMYQFETPAPEFEPDGAPFGAVSVCKTAEHTASLVAAIISDRLSQNDAQKTRLVMSLTTYFGKVGIDNEETFAFMGRENSLTTEGIKDEALTLPVMLSNNWSSSGRHSTELSLELKGTRPPRPRVHSSL